MSSRNARTAQSLTFDRVQASAIFQTRELAEKVAMVNLDITRLEGRKAELLAFYNDAGYPLPPLSRASTEWSDLKEKSKAKVAKVMAEKQRVAVQATAQSGTPVAVAGLSAPTPEVTQPGQTVAGKGVGEEMDTDTTGNIASYASAVARPPPSVSSPMPKPQAQQYQVDWNLNPGTPYQQQPPRPTIKACTAYWFNNQCPTELTGAACPDSHEWVHSLVGHVRFKKMQEQGNYSPRIRNQLNIGQGRTRMQREPQRKPTPKGDLIPRYEQQSTRPAEVKPDLTKFDQPMKETWSDEVQEDHDREMDIAEEEHRP
jgi:hypothetical protein